MLGICMSNHAEYRQCGYNVLNRRMKMCPGTLSSLICVDLTFFAFINYSTAHQTAVPFLAVPCADSNYRVHLLS